MKAYITIIKTRFILLLQYRMAAIAGMGTQFFFGIVRVMIFEGFYSSSAVVQPISFAQTVSYIWLGQALLGILPWNGDNELQSMIRSGNVAYELCRPIDLYNQWYCRAIAQRTAPTLLKAIPIFFTALFFLPQRYALQLPASREHAAAWAVSMIGALLVAASITTLFSISMLYTISGEGITRLIPALVIFFSGMSAPLQLFPQWMQAFLKYQPFSTLIDLPMRLYCGTIPASQIIEILILQLFWAAALVLLGRYLTCKAMNRVVVLGG